MDGLDALWALHCDVPQGIRMQVGIAGSEIAANIVEHSGATVVTVSMHVAASQIHLHFTDDGQAADVDLAAVLMPDAFAERGRGLALAKATLDFLAYRRDQLGNHWMLVSRPFA